MKNMEKEKYKENVEYEFDEEYDKELTVAEHI